MNDDLGDRMKLYEQAEAGRRLMPLLPALARLDGKCFSGLTRKLRRPYDPRLSRVMVWVTRRLAEETVACCAYTQSDEITLVWLAESPKSQIFLDGKIHKMVSVLAGMAAVEFTLAVDTFGSELFRDVCGPAVFDCRVWNVPNEDEAANTFLWRELDATKNSVSMAARHYYSHADLHGKDGREMLEMLFAKGVNWNDYPVFFKRGTFVQRRKVVRPYRAEELEKLPPKHEARQNPDLVVERTEYLELEMPPFGRVRNRPGVILRGEEPVVEENRHG